MHSLVIRRVVCDGPVDVHVPCVRCKCIAPQYYATGTYYRETGLVKAVKGRDYHIKLRLAGGACAA
jgi:hypothetical protein